MTCKSDRRSLGEKNLLAEETPSKKRAAEAISACNFESDFTELDESFKLELDDPETRIYWSNAKAANELLPASGRRREFLKLQRTKFS